MARWRRIEPIRTGRYLRTSSSDMRRVRFSRRYYQNMAAPFTPHPRRAGRRPPVLSRAPRRLFSPYSRVRYEGYVRRRRPRSLATRAPDELDAWRPRSSPSGPLRQPVQSSFRSADAHRADRRRRLPCFIPLECHPPISQPNLLKYLAAQSRRRQLLSATRPSRSAELRPCPTSLYGAA